MKITICGSIVFAHEMHDLAQKLEKLGHEVIIPVSANKILKGEFSVDQIIEEKRTDKFAQRTLENDAIRDYYKKIVESEAVLIVNLDKNGIENYIGGNAFLEMGFAYVLNKKIFLYNDIPDMAYKDEIMVMQPAVIYRDLGKI